MKKSTKSNIPEKSSKNPQRKIKQHENKWFQEYRSVITGEIVIIGDTLQKLINEMFNYARENPKARLVHFLHGKGIPYNTFMSWCDYHPELKQALEEFNLMIADTLEGTAREKNDIGFTIRSMSFYSPSWKQFDNERQKNRNNVDESPKTIVIEIPDHKVE